MPRFRSKHRTVTPPYRRRRFLCSAGEWGFCRELQAAVGERYEVMMQVRVGSLLEYRPEVWERWGRRVSQKSSDFVLVQRGGFYVAAAVELDDPTHLLPERRWRDRFIEDACRSAGLPLIRFETAGRYDQAEIRRAVRAALRKDAGVIRSRGRTPHSPTKRGKPIRWIWERIVQRHPLSRTKATPRFAHPLFRDLTI